MKTSVIFWLRFSYWAGAVVDLAAGLIMLIPGLFARMADLASFTPTPDFRFVAGMGAPVMFGWTVLLLWADRKPLERKAVLLLTLIPLLGNAINQAAGLASGFLTLEAVLPLWANQTLLTALYLFSYCYARWQENILRRPA